MAKSVLLGRAMAKSMLWLLLGRASPPGVTTAMCASGPAPVCDVHVLTFLCVFGPFFVLWGVTLGHLSVANTLKSLRQRDFEAVDSFVSVG